MKKIFLLFLSLAMGFAFWKCEYTVVVNEGVVREESADERNKDEFFGEERGAETKPEERTLPDEPSCTNHPLYRQPCVAGRGVCQEKGHYDCVSGSSSPRCDAKEAEERKGWEVCNLQDDDCDGKVDEHCLLFLFSSEFPNARTFDARKTSRETWVLGSFEQKAEIHIPSTQSMTSTKKEVFLLSIKEKSLEMQPFFRPSTPFSHPLDDIVGASFLSSAESEVLFLLFYVHQGDVCLSLEAYLAEKKEWKKKPVFCAPFEKSTFFVRPTKSGFVVIGRSTKAFSLQQKSFVLSTKKMLGCLLSFSLEGQLQEAETFEGDFFTMFDVQLKSETTLELLGAFEQELVVSGETLKQGSSTARNFFRFEKKQNQRLSGQTLLFYQHGESNVPSWTWPSFFASYEPSRLFLFSREYSVNGGTFGFSPTGADFEKTLFSETTKVHGFRIEPSGLSLFASWKGRSQEPFWASFGWTSPSLGLFLIKLSEKKRGETERGELLLRAEEHSFFEFQPWNSSLSSTWLGEGRSKGSVLLPVCQATLAGKGEKNCVGLL